MIVSGASHAIEFGPLSAQAGITTLALAMPLLRRMGAMQKTHQRQKAKCADSRLSVLTEAVQVRLSARVRMRVCVSVV